MPDKQINAALGMLYLCGCIVTDTKPSVERLADINLRDLYGISKFHSLSAIVCEALEQTEFTTTEEKQYLAAFQAVKKKAVRKNLLLDTERTRLLSFMEQRGIWYMPLKGVIIKDMYPKIGLRQMADNDILFDVNYRKVIYDWFVGEGYEVKVYDKGNHDVYLKEPVYNYEMHISLYGETHSQELQNYYKNVKDRLVKDSDNKYGYHFTDEDFYIYFLSHGFKHYDGSGNGLRFLCDLYVYLKEKQAAMDFAYIGKELQTLGLVDFELNCRELVSEIFGDIDAFDFETLSQAHKEMLTYFLSSGTYGTIEQGVQKAINKHGKFKYLLWRIFPGTETLKVYHPVFKHKCLMPIGWFYRAIKIVFTRPGSVLQMVKAFIKANNNENDLMNKQ